MWLLRNFSLIIPTLYVYVVVIEVVYIIGVQSPVDSVGKQHTHASQKLLLTLFLGCKMLKALCKVAMPMKAANTRVLTFNILSCRLINQYMIMCIYKNKE